MNPTTIAAGYLALLCVSCTIHLEYAQDDRTIYLLVMAPFPSSIPSLNPLYAAGHSLLPAAELAAEHINNDPSLLANRTVKLIIGESGCDKISVTVTTLLRRVVAGDVRIMGIIGPACSASALSLATLTSESRLGVIQVMIANSPLLNNHSALPYTFGTVSSSLIYVNIIVELMRQKQWEKVAILYDARRPYHIRTHLELLNKLNSSTVTFVGGMFDEYIPLDELMDAMDTRIVIVLSSNGLAQKLLCIAGNIGFTHPVYQFVFTDRSVASLRGQPFSFTYEGKTLQCGVEVMERALNFSVLLRFALDSLPPNTTTVSGFSVGQIQQEYSNRVREKSETLNTSLSEDVFAYPYYDSTWAMAKALDATLSQVEDMLTERSYIASNVTRTIRDAMYDLDFQGVSATVKFDRKDGHVTSNVDIFQAQDLNSSLNMQKIAQWTNRSIVYVVGVNSTFIESLFEKSFVSVHPALAHFGLLFVLVALVLSLTLQVINILYQKKRAIKADSPRLNHFIFAGCYCLLFAVILYTKITAFPSKSLDDAGRLVGTIFCNTMLFSAVLGYTLIFGTICAKSWRLYRIFSHSFQANNHLSDRPLAIIVVVLALVDFVILIPWMATGPILELAMRSIIPASSGRGMPYERIQYVCEASGDYIAFPVVLIIYQALLTGVVLAFSISNRNIKQKEFRSTKRINTLVYILVVQIILGGSLYTFLSVLINASVDLQYSFFVFTLLCAVFLCLFFLFVPQVFDLWMSQSTRIERFTSVLSNKRTSISEVLLHPKKRKFSTV